MSLLLRAVIATGGLLLHGCAFAQVKVKLDPSATVASTEGLQREVVVFPSVDERENPRSCGARRNVYGADVGRVRCQMEPTQWLNEAVLRGLHHRSFKVVQLHSAKSGSPLHVSLGLRTLFIDEILEGDGVTMVADVEVHVTVRSNTGLLAERSFFVREREFSANESSYQDTLTLASRRMQNHILDAIVELADRYPALGRAPAPLTGPSVP